MNEDSTPSIPRSNPARSDLLDSFILARMLPGKTPPTRSTLLSDLKPYFAIPQGLSDAAWGELLDARLAALVEAGLLSKRPYALTPPGRQRALRFLGLESLPANCRWSTLKSRHLMARALGIEPGGRRDWDRLADGKEGFKAALLAQLFELPVNRLPTLNQVIAALAASRGLHPARNDVNSLREATLRHWVEERGRTSVDEADRKPPSAAPSAGNVSPPSSPAAAPAPPTPSSAGLAEPDLETFARHVLRVARTAPMAKGGEKVFIRHAWDRFRQDPAAASLTREQFDARLIEANRRNLLALSRADLVVPVDPEDVRASEVRLPHGGTVHFVRIDR